MVEEAIKVKCFRLGLATWERAYGRGYGYQGKWKAYKSHSLKYEFCF